VKLLEPQKIVGLILLGVALTSCTGGSGSVSASGVGSVGGGTFSVTNVYPSAQSNNFSTPKLAGRYYVKGLQVSAFGSCPRGVVTIKVDEGGAAYPETATCGNDGTFTWSKTYIAAQEGNKTLNFRGYDLQASAVASATAVVDVRVDNTAPAAPTLVTPSSSPFTYTGGSASYVVQLSGAADVARVTGPAGAELVLTGGNFEYATTLVPGSTVNYTFYAYDLAGNQSAGTNLTIDYTPSVDVRIADSFLGGQFLDGVTNFSIEASGTSLPDRVVDSGTSYILETGFNFITNQVRSDP
jgi:hypothetical protein